MNEDLDLIMMECTDSMESAVSHLKTELTKIRAGKANPSMLDPVMVEAYGMQNPLKQLASISTPDARTISVQPFDKSTLADIEKGILQANIGLTPQNDGEFIRLNLPPLTEERRKELSKNAKEYGENAKVSIRGARKSANDDIKKLEKDGLSEDMAKDAESSVQNLTNKFSNIVDELIAAKEADIMTV